MRVLFHENHDKFPNVTPIQHFWSGLVHANQQVLSMVPNIYQKLDSVMCTFSNMSILNILFEKMILFSPISGRLGIEHVFRTGLDRCPLYTYNGKKTRIHQPIFFFVIFQLLINVNLLFNSWNIMIEPIYHRVLVYLLKNNMKILLCIKAWPSGWGAWLQS